MPQSSSKKKSLEQSSKKQQMSCMCGDVPPMSGGGLHGGSSYELGHNIMNLAIPIGFILAQHALIKTRGSAANSKQGSASAKSASAKSASTRRSLRGSSANRQVGGTCGMCFGNSAFSGGGLFQKLGTLQNGIAESLN